MVLKVRIVCDNAAFFDDGTGYEGHDVSGLEPARILRKIAAKLDVEDRINNFGMRLLDSNGNYVGDVEVDPYVS